MAKRRAVVTGVGTVEVVPDRVELSLGVAGQGPTPGEAFRAASGASRDLLGLLDGAGVAAAERRTTAVSVRPLFDGGTRQQPTGHEAQVSVLVRCADLERAAGLLEAASRALEACLRVHGLVWVAADTVEARTQASRAALAAALGRARTLAEGAGLRLGRVRSIVEHPQVGLPHRQARGFSSSTIGGGGGPALEAGSHDVVVAVEVEVELDED